ncbi:MAG: DUF1467 family protein [Parvibaculum sp.]|uniref:DUF1467 family protein n=1 Tax=Parvibaculum sp. TaxID=2024848 RepID=UPI0025FB07E9|nr:DUF1467 family protein [Parvibaculum sp.]MCE9651399.1 DUF1467 family protein [Parvibaculum sp.]
MTWTAGIAIYMVTWWVVLFAVLPFGVESQHERNEGAGPGFDPGAPVRPLLVRKALATTVIAAIIWSGIAYVIVDKPLGFDQIPFMPKFTDWPGAEKTPEH